MLKVCFYWPTVLVALCMHAVWWHYSHLPLPSAVCLIPSSSLLFLQCLHHSRGCHSSHSNCISQQYPKKDWVVHAGSSSILRGLLKGPPLCRRHPWAKALLHLISSGSWHSFPSSSSVQPLFYGLWACLGWGESLCFQNTYLGKLKNVTDPQGNLLYDEFWYKFYKIATGR